MQLNTQLHGQPRCRFSLHKLYAELVGSTVEAGVFDIDISEPPRLSFNPYLSTAFTGAPTL